MHISLQIVNGNSTLNLEVDSSKTIDLKIDEGSTQQNSQTGLLLGDEVIQLYGKTSDGKTIVNLKADISKVINLKIREGPICQEPRADIGQDMQIFIKILTGEIIAFKVDRFENIGNLKAKISKSYPNISVQQQRLAFKSCLLKDSLTVADYNIHKDSTLHLVRL